MESNTFSAAARSAVPEQAHPSSVKGYAGWALGLLIAAGLVLGMAGTLYVRLLPPVERPAAAGPAPVAPVREPLPPPPSLDLSACTPGQPAYALCHNSAVKRYVTARDEWQAGFEREGREWIEGGKRYDAEFAAWAERSAAAKRPLIKRLAERWQFWAGLGLLAAAVVISANRPEPAVPAHRDPDGAAAAAIKADAEAAPTAAVAAAAGVTLLASLHSFTAFVVVGGVAALVAWSAVGTARTKRAAAEGYRVADQQWQEQARAAELAGQVPPPEPRVSTEEAATLSRTGGFTAPEGSAMAALLDDAGRPNLANAAWLRVAQALGLGTADDAGPFTPWAVLEHATWWEETGDVELVWRLEDVTKTALDMNRAMPAFLREARVRALVGGACTTRHEDGRVVGRFTNNSTAPVTAPAAAEVDDDWDF